MKFFLAILFLASCDQTPVEGPTPCPGRFDSNLNLPCATESRPFIDDYGYDDGMFIEDGYFVVPTCEVCEPVQ
jgi:hypothetical protein